MSSHVETPNRVIDQTVGKTTFRSKMLSQDNERLNFQLERNNYLESLANRSVKPSSVLSATLGLQSRFNQDRVTNFAPNTAASRTFGLQTRNNMVSSTRAASHLKNTFNLNQDIANGYPKSKISSRFRAFDLIPENLSIINTEDNESLNSELRKNVNINSSLMPRPFGLQANNLTLNSDFFSENQLKENPDLNVVNYRKSSTEKITLSKTFGLGSEKMRNNLNGNDTEGFIQNSRKNSNFSSSLVSRPLQHQSSSFATHSGFLSESSSRLNQDLNYRNNNLTTAYQTFRPVVRSNIFTTESQIQNSAKHSNNMIDDSEFRRPILSRVIKGRNSVMSSRLFSDQNMQRHCRDLSNVNGFNVSHISQRDVDTLSESRLALHRRNNYIDSQSMVSSAVSGASMKAQFVNLLENLHHSILSMGPHLTIEAVRMEFDKAKQGLDNINEMSFAPSIRELDTASVISQSSKFNCPTTNDSATVNVINGGSLLLKSSKEVLKTLFSSKTNQKSECNLSTHIEEGGKRKDMSSPSKKDSDNEEVSKFLFKKPKPYFKRGKGLRSIKIKASEVGKGLISEKENKIISLKEWYPIAFGSDLAFCGVNEEGVTVETNPVKKRLNCRKIELINGLCCNLIGSPSARVSALPKEVAKFLKNGLTDRWRVFQKELLNYQMAFKDPKKNSPTTVPSSKKTMPRTPERKATKAKTKSPKVMSSRRPLKKKSPASKEKKPKGPKAEFSPQKSRNVVEILTRSGRIVKPPAMFWLKLGKEEENSLSASTMAERPSRKKYPMKKSNDGTPAKKLEKAITGSRKKECKKKDNDTVGEKVKVSSLSSPAKSKRTASSSKKSKRKAPATRTPKKKRQKKSDQVTVCSSKEDDTRETRSKRKREVAGDNDSVQTKKSKLEKKEVEVKYITGETEPVTEKKKKKRGAIGGSSHSPKSKAKKSPGKKRKKVARETKSERKTERKDLNEFEEDFELQLDDIEIPEITNISEDPKLSRSQLRMVSMETPPLKYFNSNLRLFGSSTPIASPNWCISQKTESEVKRFQERREEAFKKKARVDLKKTVVTKKTTKTVQSKDLKRVMEWVAEKAVKSPVWKSKVLKYVIPSRKRQEEQEDDDEMECEDVDTEFS